MTSGSRLIQRPTYFARLLKWRDKALVKVVTGVRRCGKSVWEDIKPRLCSDEMTYVFLDEVQRVPEFEKLVDGLCTKKNVDVYLTGSNA